MIIIITIICCGVQVHLLLSEKVKVSQTSQSRPAALTTSYTHITLTTALQSCTAAECGLTTPPMQCNAVLLWCRSGQRWAAPLMLLAEKLTDSDTWSQVKPR